jgi:hypothetical protein
MLLPAGREEWGHAIAAEISSIDGAWARLRFAVSAALGITSVVLRDAAHGRIADPGAVAAAVVIGLVASATDMSASSRAAAAAVVAAGSLTLAAVVGRAPWRWPLLVGGVLPLWIAVTGNPGPYYHDRGDQWYAMGLAAAAAVLGVGVRLAVLAIRRVRHSAAAGE